MSNPYQSPSAPGSAGADIVSWQPTWLTAIGWVITVLMVAALLLSASIKLSVPLKIGEHEKFAEMFEKQGFSVQTMTIIGIVEITCALIYLFPKTSILGAALLNGYLGGAIVTHVLQKENIAAPLIIGILVWLGIFLREPRLRSIMFWR